MSILEIFATISTVASVLLAVQRSIWQFPVGLAATTAFFFVFFQSQLYASTALQVFFSIIQLYGWWYWLRGDRGMPPRMSSVPIALVLILCGGAFLPALGISTLLTALTNARVAFMDSAIFTLSALAQFLLDRKKLETWIVWALVNLLSVFVYGSQELWLTAALYSGLLANCAWGWSEWRKELLSDRTSAMTPGHV
jgi:nicotinamide mononucleotide transporter